MALKAKRLASEMAGNDTSAWRFVTESCQECGDDLQSPQLVGTSLKLCSSECTKTHQRNCVKPYWKPKTGRPTGRPGKSIEQDEVINRHLNGETVTVIAHSLGVDNKRIKELLNSAGIPIRKMAWGKNHSRWTGGRYVDPYGYVQITLDRNDPLREGRNNREHRYVMAKFLGRKLKTTETVHHKDGNRSNNDLDNLQLRSGPHGEGIILTCLDCGSHNILPEEL